MGEQFLARLGANRRRGQTLVLFALTLLLLMLMVAMTLSFSTKAKEKMELQQIADQAAYSNSVVVARGFNSLALLNRVQIADMVAIAGIQSALSYAASYRGLLQGAERSIQVTQASYSSQCGGTLGLYEPACRAHKALGKTRQLVEDEKARVEREWNGQTMVGAYLGSFGRMDTVVGLYAMLWQMNALSIFMAHQQEVFEKMASRLDEQTLARAVMQHAVGGKPGWDAPPAASFVSNREIGDIKVGTGLVNGATLRANVINQHAVVAAMASRGNWWVTARLGESGLLERKLNQVFNPPPGNVPEFPVPIVLPKPESPIPGVILPDTEYWEPPPILLPPTDPVLTVKLLTPSPLFPAPPMPSWFPSGLSNMLRGPIVGKGDAYFSDQLHGAANFRLAIGPFGGSPNDLAVTADDHAGGFLQFWQAPFRVYPLAFEPLPFSGFGRASAGPSLLNTNLHKWVGFPIPMEAAEMLMQGRGGRMPNEESEIPPVHPLQPLSGQGVWPPFIDYNFAKVLMDNDAYGQPKNFAVIQRNYADPSLPADPWNFFFRFRLNGPGEKYGQGTQSNPNAVVLGDGTDISKQTALSSGIAYYHRYGHWKEGPNLFNPFWRAGLTRANIDPKSMDGVGRDWFEDAAETMNRSNVPWAGDAIKSLAGVGYQGVQ